MVITDNMNMDAVFLSSCELQLKFYTVTCIDLKHIIQTGFFLDFFNVYLFLRETERVHESKGGAEREGDRG